MRQSPGDVRGAEEAEGRYVEADAKVAGAAVGGHQERRAADTRLSQAEARRLVGQADDSRTISELDDTSSRVQLAGAADDEDAADLGFSDQPPGEDGEVAVRPAFRRTERSAGVEDDDRSITREAEPEPGPVCGQFVVSSRMQVEPETVARAADGLREGEVSIDDRRWDKLAPFVAQRFESIRQEPPAPPSIIADPPLRPRSPSHER